MLVLQGMGCQHYRVCDVSTTEYVMLVLQGVGHGMSVILQDMRMSAFQGMWIPDQILLKIGCLTGCLTGTISSTEISGNQCQQYL